MEPVPQAQHHHSAVGPTVVRIGAPIHDCDTMFAHDASPLSICCHRRVRGLSLHSSTAVPCPEMEEDVIERCESDNVCDTVHKIQAIQMDASGCSGGRWLSQCTHQQGEREASNTSSLGGGTCSR